MTNNVKRVRIIAETHIDYPDNQKQTIRHAGYGMLSSDGNEFCLTYEDFQENERFTIRLIGNKEKVRMERDGAVKGKLLFIPGSKTESVYELEYGQIEVCIQTTLIECIPDESDGRILLVYQSGMNGEIMNQTQYLCRWKS